MLKERIQFLEAKSRKDEETIVILFFIFFLFQINKHFFVLKLKQALKKLLDKSGDKELVDEGNSILKKNGFEGSNSYSDYNRMTPTSENKESTACIII